MIKVNYSKIKIGNLHIYEDIDIIRKNTKVLLLVSKKRSKPKSKHRDNEVHAHILSRDCRTNPLYKGI
jgi:hypothetical protein